MQSQRFRSGQIETRVELECKPVRSGRMECAGAWKGVRKERRTGEQGLVCIAMTSGPGGRGETAGRFAVMMAGHTTPDMEARWGDYGQMAVRLLKEEGETWDTFYVCDAQLPSDAQLQSYNGIVITGSKHDAHGEDGWIKELRELMGKAAGRGQRILGICFGCQLLAIALGGLSGRAGINELGTKVLQAEPSLQQMRYGAGYRTGDRFPIVESHQDAISRLPSGAVLLAKSGNTPVEMWALSDNVLGIQGHPEFSSEFTQALLRYRLDLGILTAQQVEAAEAALEHQPVSVEESERMRRLCVSFLKL
eukprot:jgi/Botrbrau1/18890/Bobra.177_2s0048.1